MFTQFVRALALFAICTAASASTIEMQVNGLVCAFCAQGIEKTLRAKPETADVFVSLEAGLVALTVKPDQDLSDAALRDALTESGYTVTKISRTERSLQSIKKQLEQSDE